MYTIQGLVKLESAFMASSGSLPVQSAAKDLTDCAGAPLAAVSLACMQMLVLAQVRLPMHCQPCAYQYT